MKKIIGYIRQHLKEDFNPGVYLSVFLFLTTAIIYNYSVDFEDSFLDLQTGVVKVFYFFLFYSLPFYLTLVVYAVFTRDFEFLRSLKFWVLSGIGFLLLSIDSSALYLSDVTRLLFPNTLFFWGFKVSNNFLSLLTMTAPLILMGLLVGRKKSHLFGLNTTQFDATPYLLMLMIMIPFLIMASFLPGFLNQYPMYNSGNSIQDYPQPELVFAGIYEVGYALNFISVELFFRGFLVIGLMSIAGRKVVLAMAATYCFLHFGKPAGEAISSIFGGFLLGVIAYETKSIWGGVIIHIGIAWAMELVAIVQHSIRIGN